MTTGGANKFLYTLIITGALVSSIPLLIGCIILQRFWRMSEMSFSLLLPMFAQVDAYWAHHSAPLHTW